MIILHCKIELFIRVIGTLLSNIFFYLQYPCSEQNAGSAPPTEAHFFRLEIALGFASNFFEHPFFGANTRWVHFQPLRQTRSNWQLTKGKGCPNSDNEFYILSLVFSRPKLESILKSLTEVFSCWILFECVAVKSESTLKSQTFFGIVSSMKGQRQVMWTQ